MVGSPDQVASWLPFIDADVTLDANALRATSLETQRRSVDLPTPYPRCRMKNFRLLIRFLIAGRSSPCGFSRRASTILDSAKTVLSMGNLC
ncbi:MAG: hypothetical protein R3F37_11060 [Candidatus Competibacteraceae bacterium]